MSMKLNREHQYYAQELAAVYRKPYRYSSVYKQELYELANRDSAIHYEALKINRSRRYHKAI